MSAEPSNSDERIDAEHPRPPQRMPDQPGDQGASEGRDPRKRADPTDETSDGEQSVDRYRDAPGAGLDADGDPPEPNEPG